MQIKNKFYVIDKQFITQNLFFKLKIIKNLNRMLNSY